MFSILVRQMPTLAVRAFVNPDRYILAPWAVVYIRQGAFSNFSTRIAPFLANHLTVRQPPANYLATSNGNGCLGPPDQ